MSANHHPRECKYHHNNQGDGEGFFTEIAQHEASKNHQHHTVVAREAVLRGVFGWNMKQLADAVNIRERERRTGAFNRHQMLRQLVDNHGCQQHDQADNQNTATTRFVFLQPEGEHQTAHCQQRTAVKRAVVGDRHQPQEGFTLRQRLVKEVEQPGIQREPESVIRRDIPGEKDRQTGSVEQ